MLEKSTSCSDHTDHREKVAAGRDSRRKAAAIERARADVITAARVIAEADYGKTYPDLHRALARLNRSLARG